MIRTKYWVMALLLVCAGCVAAILALDLGAPTAGAARVLQEGRLLYRLPLSEDTQITIDAPNGGSNTVAVRDGSICVLQATCPDQVCVRRGWVSSTAAPIVCLPHGLVIELEGGELYVDAQT